jgi:hypothetical protein
MAASPHTGNSPVLRLVTHLLKSENRSGKPIQPRAWIMELLTGMKDTLRNAGLDFEGHRGATGTAFLRDTLAGPGGEQAHRHARPIDPQT